MKNLFIIMVIALITTSCATTHLIHQYKNPDTGFFESNKVFIIGLEGDSKLRGQFEKSLVRAFEDENVRAVKSIDFFEDSFTKEKKTIEELNKIETTLLNAEFDAILLTKVTGTEKRYYTSSMVHQFMTSNQTFEDYYYGNQYKYLREKGKEEDYTVYIVETSLYCICPEKERELLWRSEIEVTDTKDNQKNINSYIKELFKNLEKNDLILID
ncbi:hypothetical protein ACOSP6_04085 [Tenacibaculum sp. MEBiC06402]|uniref:hypothetical protein n=1 Tax=unclassified Tenacibaculum TaxID=2635139 RepID=UPI003B9C75E9